MRIWIYVEGPSDRSALEALFGNWKKNLGERSSGIGLSIISLTGKSRFLKAIGPRVAANLFHTADDIAVGLPDLHPTYPSGQHAHRNLASLQELQRKLVKDSLVQHFKIKRNDLDSTMERFQGSALKHDLEMLLLASKAQLRKILNTSDRLGNWTNPVENQNNDRPPKLVVKELFRTKSQGRKNYRETIHAPQILRPVSSDIGSLLHDRNGVVQCPEFKRMLDWMGTKTGVPVYT